MPTFNPGDKVVLDPTLKKNQTLHNTFPAQLGNVYTVDAHDGPGFVYLKEPGRAGGALFADRFRLATAEELVPFKVGDLVTVDGESAAFKRLQGGGAPLLDWAGATGRINGVSPRAGLDGQGTQTCEVIFDQPQGTHKTPYSYIPSGYLKQEGPMPKFKRGDRVVVDAVANERRGRTPELKENVVYIVEDPTRIGGQEMTVREEATGDRLHSSFYQDRFKLAPAAAEPRAMTIEVAREQRKRLAQATGNSEKSYRLRSRSWDTEGLYFAIEWLSAGGSVLQKFYKPSEVDTFIANLTPIDVTGVKNRSYWTFQTPEGKDILAEDRSRYWTLSEIKECNGIVTQDGRRYRLGENKGFVPFA